MSKFRKYRIKGVTDLNHKYSHKIVEVFGKLSTHVFATINTSRKPSSNRIKYDMVDLGHKLGYRVYANGLTHEQIEEQKSKHGFDFVNKEFLFDIHWYQDKKGEYYIPEILSLVAESELGDKRKGDKSGIRNTAIMFDFQKLLVTNAQLRLLIFKTKNISELEDLELYFEKSIESYPHLEKGSLFLFLCFELETKSLYYTEKIKM